jgi:hypothetical protein
VEFTARREPREILANRASPDRYFFPANRAALLLARISAYTSSPSKVSPRLIWSGAERIYASNFAKASCRAGSQAFMIRRLSSTSSLAVRNSPDSTFRFTYFAPAGESRTLDGFSLVANSGVYIGRSPVPI